MPDSSPKAHIASLRFWGTWCLIACGWLTARLPLNLLFPLGKHLGRLAFRLNNRRRSITETNLGLCFPELGRREVEGLAEQVFEAVMLGVLEICIAWLNPARDLRHRFNVEGIERFRAAMGKSRGLVLLGGHFAVMDIIARTLSGLGQIDVMYRRNRNPVWEWLQVRGRKHYFGAVIERKNMRGALRALRSGHAVWYAADQDYGPKHSVFAPFFGVQTATITAGSRLASFNQAPMLMLVQHRDYATRSWTLRFEPVPSGFPSKDDGNDAACINQLIEAAVRKHPDQYLWLHRRFKTRPPGEPSFYKK